MRFTELLQICSTETINFKADITEAVKVSMYIVTHGKTNILLTLEVMFKNSTLAVEVVNLIKYVLLTIAKKQIPINI
jgi:hypothetical protein